MIILFHRSVIQIKGSQVLVGFAFHFNAATQNLDNVGNDVVLNILSLLSFKAIQYFSANRYNCLELRHHDPNLQEAKRRIRLQQYKSSSALCVFCSAIDKF
jgi:hypothetical protein